jgi:Uma2 family endonuclease
MVIQEKFYTAADLWALTHHESERRFELTEGVLIEMSPAGGKHGGLAHELGRRVGNLVVDKKLGYVTAAETGYILNKDPKHKDTVRAPDVGFVAKERLPDGLPDGYIPLAPDLAIEVVSPNDSAEEIASKISDYTRFGVRMFWFFYPKPKKVHVHTPPNLKILSVDDVLDGGDVLPGFKLALKDIFED